MEANPAGGEGEKVGVLGFFFFFWGEGGVFFVCWEEELLGVLQAGKGEKEKTRRRASLIRKRGGSS